ncbi:hypothetical protein RO3G_04922 [Rhizopus delemar RA 99-880]|uniref:Uncharacterized protein n=1 Tax=Rhizopus delemar (strain RA 99-880 / ATCC MYA-4621 / FGSC 9543 / NRRL 43880) TaxID=246409 RepID=I1BVI7_RHIO9|nr:hypothetical protein RO3G_04922 [Rhizopus delemar RA 99-880]|eukprot:EIE80217.1 hypothetical protein RO3G_04922 [Rhizopus delemar RA 99-880]
MSETDRDIFLNIIQQVERLAIFGYSSAKFQENEAKKLVIKSFKWPSSLRHLESSTEDGSSKKLQSIREEDIIMEEEAIAMTIVAEEEANEVETGV